MVLHAWFFLFTTFTSTSTIEYRHACPFFLYSPIRIDICTYRQTPSFLFRKVATTIG
jgi:hypothetical protein